VALWSALSAATVLAGAGFAFRQRLLEEYWLWVFRREDWEGKDRAAVELGGMRSKRAVPVLFQAVCERPRNWRSQEDFQRFESQPAVLAILNAGPATAPFLFEKMKHTQCNWLAERLLLYLAAREPEVIPLLVNGLADPDRRIQDSSMAVLTMLGRAAIPDLCRALSSRNDLTAHNAMLALDGMRQVAEAELPRLRESVSASKDYLEAARRLAEAVR
jgi:HEAT repeat protein